ncbi:MAG: hypothetical protein ACXV5O_01135 [Candidatus Aminicenantales bacterium]
MALFSLKDAKTSNVKVLRPVRQVLLFSLNSVIFASELVELN